MSDFGDVTVIIPQWNRAGLLRTVLKHLQAQTYPIQEIIVVDNGSTDDSVAVAREGGATVIALGVNRGFATAVNRGIEKARSEWVVILNNDVTLDPQWLEELAGGASRAGAWFATGKLLADGRGDVIDGTFDLVCRGGAAWRGGSGKPDGPIWWSVRPIQFVPLTAALLRRELFHLVGLLDERFESYLEDVDLGLRCAAVGLSGVYIPSARGWHTGSATRGAWHKATVRQIARNQMFIVAKHFHDAPALPIVVAQLLWAGLAFRHLAPFAWIAGKWEGLRRRAQFRQPGGWSKVRNAVERSEDELFDYQRNTGFDAYWRCYFMLTGGRTR